ncbi:MAG: hydroxymethylbilane synthase [Spirochaetes bacterium GWD1_27_9]|nr:MAG: hydroxymethylbilane synthase [Spirochaetes bacterium GWC1_27_15]OHD45112.1 MAG: hydroxymethylbilane synthase [Spirochaetes bacterium GWD1_27_9]
MKNIIIGTRGSILALAQADIVIQKLKINFPEHNFSKKVIKTSGDINLSTSLQNDSLKRMFVKEIEAELLEGQIDIAVHSLKDMPSDMPDGLIIGAIPPRENPSDVFISKNNKKLAELPLGSVIATSSLRRKIQIENYRKDLKIVEIRGNIHTRLKKLEQTDIDGIILAGAGLKRVGLEDKITEYFNYDIILPAPGQGALCIQCREGNDFIKDIVFSINEPVTQKIVLAEREFSRIFDGGCKVPIAAYGEIKNGNLDLDGMFFYDDKIIRDKESGKLDDFMEVARRLSDKIKNRFYNTD